MTPPDDRLYSHVIADTQTPHTDTRTRPVTSDTTLTPWRLSLVSPRVTRQASNARCLKSSTIDTWLAKLPTQTRTTSVADRRAVTTKQKGGKNTNSGKQDSGRGPRTAAKVKSVSFLSYNICGLRSKINDADFISYVNKFDFVCLLETFVEDLKTNVFYNFIHFVSPAVKLSRAGRRSGGVLLLIKKIIGGLCTRDIFGS